MCQVQYLTVCMNCWSYRVVVVDVIPYRYTLIVVSHLELEEQAMFIT